MFFRNSYLPDNLESIKNTEASNDVSNFDRFELEPDFVEHYEDLDGVQHVKTVFSHDDMDEQDLWEVFDAKDGSASLELLLHDDV